MRETLDIHLDKKAQELKQIPKGRHRVTDFIIYPYCAVSYRSPYSFVYLEEGEEHPYKDVFRHQKKVSPLGYCPVITQWTLDYLLADALSFCIGNKYSKEIYRNSLLLWKKKKKKKSAKQRPQKGGSCFPIAKNTHFFIKIEGLGLFYFQMVYRRKKKDVKRG